MEYLLSALQVTNLVFIPIIYLFYPETAGLTLDEIDHMFELKHAPGAKMTYADAAKQARIVMEEERLQLGSRPQKVPAQHVEAVV